MPSGRSFFCLTEHDTEEDREQCGGQDASLPDAVGDGEAARQRPIVLRLTFLTFMELAEVAEKFGGTTKARQDFPQSITADSIKSPEWGNIPHTNHIRLLFKNINAKDINAFHLVA